jgi:hypothetical protein
MRIVLGLILVAACSTSPEAPPSYAQLSGSMQVRAARAQPGFVSYGAPYHKWTVTLATTEGCAGDTSLELEVNTLSSVLEMPTGTITVRTIENDITALPSAYVRYMGAPVLAGTVTIDSATVDYISGSLSAMLMLNGTPTEVTASFGAPVCPG